MAQKLGNRLFSENFRFLFRYEIIIVDNKKTKIFSRVWKAFCIINSIRLEQDHII